MRFYTGQHQYYCGIDLHARTMYLCVLKHESGEVVLHRNLRCEPDAFLQAIAPCREDLVVGIKCIFCWHWRHHPLSPRPGLPFLRPAREEPEVLGRQGHRHLLNKIGNAHLKWAYSEAAVLFLQKKPPGQRLINRLRLGFLHYAQLLEAGLRFQIRLR